MSFLHGFPLVLLLSLPIIPLLLHLLTLRRLRTIEIPTYRFLFDSYVQQKRRTRFLETLLVLLRMLVVAGIILFLARPMCNRASNLFPPGSGRDVFILVDCSASMNATAGGGTALDRARKHARGVLQHLAKDDRVTLIRVTGRPEVIVSRFSVDAENLGGHIDNLQLSPARANLFAALQSIFGDERKRPASPLVYYFTDCQASGWTEVEQQKQSERRFLPADTPFILVDVSSEQSRPNIAVTGLPPSKQRAVVGLPIDLQARVHNHGNIDVEAILTLSINDKVVERRTVVLPRKQEEIVNLAPYFPTEESALRARIEIAAKEPSHDSFLDDNTWEFALRVQSRLRVLIINGGPNPDAFEDETLYLRAALGRSKEGTATPDRADLRKILEAVTEPETVFANLDEAGVRAKLEPYHLVVLANCGVIHQVNPQTFARLREFVAEGGGLLIFPGDLVNPRIYNAALFAASPPHLEQLTTARLGSPVGDVERSDSFAHIANDAVDGFGHRVAAIFRQPQSAKSRYFQSIAIKRRFPIELADSKNVGVILRYRDRDRSPAMIESRFGEGMVILSSFPINAKWTNLPLNRAEFVPLMIELIRHAQKKPDVEGPSVVPADENAEFSASNAWLPIAAEVARPSGGRSDLYFERAGTRAVAVYEKTDVRGFYEVKIGSGRDSARAEHLSFAVNLAPEESDPAKIDERSARDLLPDARLTFENRTAESSQREPADTRREYWRELILVLFAVVVCEFLLATLRVSGKHSPHSSSE